MNGRIYDPVISRFVSADILVQNPTDRQSFNRYSYVMNNPLTLVDPTGYTAANVMTNRNAVIQQAVQRPWV